MIPNDSHETTKPMTNSGDQVIGDEERVKAAHGGRIFLEEKPREWLAWADWGVNDKASVLLARHEDLDELWKQALEHPSVVAFEARAKGEPTSVQTDTCCPGGCGGFLRVGDTFCPSCRYAPNEQHVQVPNTCWEWFGSMEHRMKCRRHPRHAGEHHDHEDSDKFCVANFSGAKLVYERRQDGYLYPASPPSAVQGEPHSMKQAGTIFGVEPYGEGDAFVGACNLLDTIKQEWGDAWSEHDQKVRAGLSAMLIERHRVASLKPEAPEGAKELEEAYEILYSRPSLSGYSSTETKVEWKLRCDEWMRRHRHRLAVREAGK